jgi:hypothetical protein
VRLRSLALSTALLILPIPLFADTVYTYTGNQFLQASAPYTTSESVSGYFDLSSPLAPNLTEQFFTPAVFSFSDGYDTFTNLTPSFSEESFWVSTDAAGNPTAWVIVLQSGVDYLHTSQSGGGGGANGDGGIIEVQGADYQYPTGYIIGSPGTWAVSSTDMSAVPEPSTFWFLGTGTLGFLGAVRRRRIVL